jgi:anti-sigma factor RsiW
MPEAEQHLTDDQLQEWLDGELAPELGAWAQEHVGRCARCAERCVPYRRLFVALDQLPAWQPSHDLSLLVLNRLEASPRQPERLPWLLAGQLLVGGIALGLSWPRLSTLSGFRFLEIVKSLLTHDWVRAVSPALRLVPPELPWEAAWAVLRLPARWVDVTRAATWPAGGALLGLSFLLWMGVNGWMLRRGTINPAGVSGR